MRLQWHKFEPDKPAELAAYFQGAEPIFPADSNLGWFINPSKKISIPTIRLQQVDIQKTHFWVQLDRLMDPKGARRRMEKRIMDAFSHFIPHDINGKVMGIDGVLEAWKDSKPDSETALEDIKLIRASLDPLQKLSNILSWITKDKLEHARAFTLFELYATFAEALPRHFKPINTFKFQPPEVKDSSHESILALPSLITFWFFGMATLLSKLKKHDETVMLTFNNTSDHHHLVFAIQCEEIANLLELPFNKSETPDVFWDWLIIFAQQNGTWQKSKNGIEFIIPLRGFNTPTNPKVLAFGQTSDFDPSDASLSIITNTSFFSVISNLVTYIFDFHSVLVSSHLESQQREIIMDILKSIHDVRLVDFSRRIAA